MVSFFFENSPFNTSGDDCKSGAKNQAAGDEQCAGDNKQLYNIVENLRHR